MSIISAESALPGRSSPIVISPAHFVSGRDMLAVPTGFETLLFGMGCFWGAERKFFEIGAVHSTSVGYAGGHTVNPTYQEVCSGRTGHTEVVRVVFEPSKVTADELLKVFWENHDPMQGMGQGADRGTQYRSAVYAGSVILAKPVERSKIVYQEALERFGRGPITTEIGHGIPFYFAEEYHQQYLAKNPSGYCGIGGTGVVCP